MPTHTISENLQRLTAAKTAISTAITNKGGTVAQGDGLEDFADDIATIPSGVDTSQDTVTEAVLGNGYTAHNAQGQQITGTAKLAGNVDLSTDSVTVDKTTTTATVTLSNATGTVTISSNGTNYTAQLQNNVITITRTGAVYETGIVIVNVAETQTYGAAQKTIAVTSDGVHLCTWADGTDEEVVSMVAAAQAGEIDLTDYWAAGDNRNGLILADGITYTNANGNQATSIFRILYKIEPQTIRFYEKTKTTGNYKVRYYTSAPTVATFLGNYRLYFKVGQNDINSSGYATTTSISTRAWYGNDDDLLLCNPTLSAKYMWSSSRTSDPASASAVAGAAESYYPTLKVGVIYRNSSSGTIFSTTLTNNPDVSTMEVGQITYCLI